jgi:outer membrane PBP1 activator LpoA protein
MNMQIVSYIKLFFCSLALMLLSGCIADHAAPIDTLAQPKPVASINEAAKNVVVLLPLSGTFASSGKIIRDGFLAAYQQAHVEKSIHLTILDSQNDTTTNGAYETAAATHPDLIVGPLTKSAVNSLSLKVTLPAPTLALNQADPNAVAPLNLFQFSLSPQADAVDTAQKMHEDDYSQAIVFAPTGEWGQGIAMSFSQEWIEQNGKILDSISYDENSNAKAQIKKLLDDHSAEELKNTGIFLVATPKTLPNILPDIKAALPGVPIYSLPIAYNQTNATQLEGVTLEVSPLMLHAQDTIKINLQQQYPDRSPEDLNLYAFGFDAFTLTQFYLSTGGFAGLSMPGYSGYLTINTNGVVNRSLTWAKVQQNQLTPLTASLKPETSS